MLHVNSKLLIEGQLVDCCWVSGFNLESPKGQLWYFWPNIRTTRTSSQIQTARSFNEEGDRRVRPDAQKIQGERHSGLFTRDLVKTLCGDIDIPMKKRPLQSGALLPETSTHPLSVLASEASAFFPHQYKTTTGWVSC